jgi:hypothetical protein
MKTSVLLKGRAEYIEEERRTRFGPTLFSINLIQNFKK